MTTLGLLIGAVAVVLLVLDRRRWLLHLLGVSAGLPIGAVLVAGGQALTAVYAVAFVIAAWQVWTFVTTRWSADLGHRPGWVLMVVFGVYSTVITLLGPTVFAGTPVLSPRGGLDDQVLNPVPLAYSVSDIAQITYTLLALSIIVFIARGKLAGPGFPGIGLTVMTLLCFWRLVSQISPVPFPDGLFDSSPNVRIIDTTETGEARFRGIYSEPSSMGAAAITATAFFVVYQRRLRGWRRVGVIVLAAMALTNGAMSSSATFVTSGVIQLSLAVLVSLVGFFYRRSLVRPLVVALVLVGSFVAAVVVPRAVLLLQALVSDKIASSSYSSRSGSDLFSVKLMLDTWGLGAGLGSNRPSSLIPSALSRVGIVGTFAFFGLILTIIRRGWAQTEYRATVWALASGVLTRLVSGPGLLEPFMAICIGVLASDLWYRRTAPDASMATRGPERHPLSA